MSKFYQIGNLTVMSDPLDDLSDSVLEDFARIHTNQQKEKWNHLTNTSDDSEDSSLENWTSIVTGNQNTERNLIHSQSNFPDL
jgi:hypothetical protein